LLTHTRVPFVFVLALAASDGAPSGGTVPPILDARISSDGSIVAFVWSSELYVVPTDGSSQPKQLTTGARGTALTNGLADYVAQVCACSYEYRCYRQ
jgi:hypothetical protein